MINQNGDTFIIHNNYRIIVKVINQTRFFLKETGAAAQENGQLKISNGDDHAKVPRKNQGEKVTLSYILLYFKECKKIKIVFFHKKD